MPDSVTIEASTLGKTSADGHRRRRWLLMLLLALTTLFSLALQMVRQELPGEGRFWHIAWDLFLAWVPLWAALQLEAEHRRGRRRWVMLLIWGVLWLLFFPNAPYLVTEFVHLGQRPMRGDAGWWCDLVVILLIAWNGVLLGFASLYLVQLVIRDYIGQAGGWIAATGCIALASLGISIGRFERLNSWDALVHPELIVRCFREFTNRHVFSHNVGLAGMLGGMLILQYVTLAALIEAATSKPSEALR